LTTPEWKWLLQQMRDQDLIKLAKRLRLRLPGKRKERWAHDFSRLRPKVVQSLLQTSNIPKLRQVLNEWVQQDSGLQQLRASSEEQLRRQLQEGQQPGPVLLALLSSSEPTLTERANSLFEYLRATGALSDWLALEQTVAESLPALNQEREAWLEERRQLERTIADLQTRLEELQAETDRRQWLWEMERQSLLSRLADRDTRLQLQKRQLAELTAEQLPDSAAPQERSDCPAPPWPGVLLVGNMAASQAEWLSQYGLEHVLPLDIHRGTARDALERADQIWMLSYATPLPVQRQLLQTEGARLRCITSYEGLVSLIEEGRRTD
jgi:hypothetical protein